MKYIINSNKMKICVNHRISMTNKIWENIHKQLNKLSWS
jgi:hypothetical protein